MTILPGAEPFILGEGRFGCLLIHGFTASPAEVRLLGEYLAGHGYLAYGVLLAGHGTTPEEMEQTTWEDWYRSVIVGLRELRAGCDRVAVIGFSMGGILALRAAAYEDVAAVVTLNAPIFPANKQLKWLPIKRLYQRFHPKPSYDPAKFAPDELPYLIGYDRTPLRSVDSMLKLIKRVKKDLLRVRVPALVVQAKDDRTVVPESANYIHSHLGSKLKRLVWRDQGGHMMVVKPGREEIFAAVVEFLTSLR